MPSNRTPTRFFGPAYLTTTPTTLYTVPGGKIAVVREIIVVSDASDDIYIGVSDTASDDLILQETVTSLTRLNNWYYLPLAAGQLLEGVANVTSTSVTVTITGDLYDA